MSDERQFRKRGGSYDYTGALVLSVVDYGTAGQLR